MLRTSKNWTPEKPTVDYVKGNIELAFKKGRKSDLTRTTEPQPAQKPENQFIESCAKVAVFLMDEQAVVNQLTKLDTILNNKLSAQPDKFAVNLLRETLEQELGKLGFHPHFGKTLENIDPVEFRSAIANGLLLKDASIGDTDHGEFTHAIQWLMIAWQQEESNFLGQPAIEIFKQLGEEKSVFYRSTVDSRNDIVEESIWDLIVDNEKQINFRSPEELNNFLRTTDNENLSIIQHLITMRMEKRIEDAKTDKFQTKYQDVLQQTEEQQGKSGKNEYLKTFSRKDNKIPYHKGKLKAILEPQDSNIDLDAFKNKK